MPELPEVETVRQSITPHIINKTIVEVQIHYAKVLPKNNIEQFTRSVQSDKIIDIQRRGKYLLFLMESGFWMIIHLRMTGRLLYYKNSDAQLAKHTSAVFTFTDKSQLRFMDQRKFGTIYFLPELDLPTITGLYTIGPEPLSLEFTPQVLQKALASSGVKIKGFLLDQKRLAGLGNIYADEVLFRAKIHPAKPACQLSEEEIIALHESVQRVLQEAIDHHGTTIKDYRTGSGTKGEFQNYLQVYGQTKQPCAICSETILRMRIAGRSSHYCPSCQRWDDYCED